MVNPLARYCYCPNFNSCWKGLGDFIVCRKTTPGMYPCVDKYTQDLQGVFSFMNRREVEDEN